MTRETVDLFTNGSYWQCKRCGEENIVIAQRCEVSVNDPEVQPLIQHMIDEGEFDEQIDEAMADRDGDDEEDDEEEVALELEGTVILFKEPRSVQCGACHAVFATNILTIEESYHARKWPNPDDVAD